MLSAPTHSQNTCMNIDACYSAESDVNLCGGWIEIICSVQRWKSLQFNLCSSWCFFVSANRRSYSSKSSPAIQSMDLNSCRSFCGWLLLKKQPVIGAQALWCRHLVIFFSVPELPNLMLPVAILDMTGGSSGPSDWRQAQTRTDTPHSRDREACVHISFVRRARSTRTNYIQKWKFAAVSRVVLVKHPRGPPAIWSASDPLKAAL